MRFTKHIYIIVFLGLLSSVSLIYFYIVQRNFTANNKHFLISLSSLQKCQGELTYSILQNSLFTYHNQDTIGRNVHNLQDALKELQDSPLLRDKAYEIIKLKLQALEEKINTNIEDVNEHLMFNAAVRNSLLFLSRFVAQTDMQESELIELYIKANMILKNFNDAMLTLDLDYIDKEEYLLFSHSSNKEVQEFIETFNLHSQYLITKLPKFMLKTKFLLYNDIADSISEINDDFTKVALEDFKSLDIFATLLFTTFLLSLALIVWLIINYIKENKKLIETKESLEYSLNNDLLTSLGNRKSFSEKLKMLHTPHLLLINIDDFKHVNDIYGDTIGNKLLRSLATFLVHFLENTPYKHSLYRIGGDEYAVLFENIPDDEALELASKIEQAIASHTFSFHNSKIKINISLSIASNSIKPILENADLALKVVKKDLLHSVISYNDSLNLKKNVKENLKIIDTIKDAINTNRVVPFFQPIVNLQTLKVEKYEALIRIKLEDGTLLQPSQFLETAKKTSHYQTLTNIMVHETLKTAEKFPTFRFSINLSMLDILNPTITANLYAKLQANPQVASRIDIELVESEKLSMTQEITQFIEQLHAFGVQILIDDFGTGYSNFSYFAALDLDIIKIDGSIVAEALEDTKKMHMLKSIYKFSRGLGLQSVAEFVETKETALMLQELGVEYAQGYYFSAPLQEPLKELSFRL